MTQFFLSRKLSISRVPTATIIDVETLKICVTAPDNHLYNLFSVHRRISVQYIGECSVHWVDIMTISGDVQYSMSRLRDVMSTSEGYHKYIVRISWGIQLIKAFHYIQNPDALIIFPHINHDMPPHKSLYPSDELNIPRCTHNIPHMNHDTPVIY